MLRALTFLVALLSLATTASVQPVPAPLDTLFAQPHTGTTLLQSLGVGGSHVSTPPAQSCCKICTVGKACGNTCISRDKTCHVGPGCACDG
jgi:hypothetical protein